MPDSPDRSSQQRSGPPASQSATRPAWVAVGVLLLIGIVAPLLVGTYDSETPTLGGVPFYFWYQFLLVPIVAVLTFAAFKIAEAATARGREARGLVGRPDRAVDEP